MKSFLLTGVILIVILLNTENLKAQSTYYQVSVYFKTALGPRGSSDQGYALYYDNFIAIILALGRYVKYIKGELLMDLY